MGIVEVGGALWKVSNSSFDFLFERLAGRFAGGDPFAEDVSAALETRFLTLQGSTEGELRDFIHALRQECDELARLAAEGRSTPAIPDYAYFARVLQTLVASCESALAGTQA